MEAISQDRALDPEQEVHALDRARYFDEPLPGRDGPIGSPGGAIPFGPVGADTALVRSHPPAG